MKQDKILIIDDDDEILGIYSKILSKKGYKVEVAADGLAGYNKVLEDKPNLILLDMILPNMTGLEILEKIKSNPDLDDIYVLLITASPDVDQLVLKGLEAGAEAYFMKGIPNKELVARVDAAFRHINTILSLRARENELLVLNKTAVERNEELKKLNINLKESQTASLNLLSDLKNEIEERKQIQKAFIESEMRFGELISTVRLLSVTLDLEGNITFCNNYLLELTGWNYDEIIGKSWFKNFIPEDIADEVLEVFQKSIHTKDYPLYYVNEILTRNGEKRIIEWNNTILKDAKSNIIGAASIGNDITEITSAQNKIKEISSYYTALIEKSSDGVAIIDEDSHFKYISPAGRKMFGYNNSETAIGNPSSLTHPDDLQTVLAELEKLIKNPDHKPVLQYRFKNKSGSWIWIESTFTNLLSDPNVNGIVINFREITERIKAEQKLKKSEETFKRFFESDPSAIFVWKAADDDFTLTEVNSSALKLTESGALKFIGKQASQIYHDLPLMLEKLNECYTNKKNIQFEHNYQNRNKGTYDWIIFRLAFLEPDTILMYSDIITERKQAEDELLQSKLIIESIINTVPARIFWKDKNLVYQGCNQEFAKDAGFSSTEEIIGKDDYQMGWRDLADLYRADDKEVIDTGKPKLQIEEEQITPQGEKITLLTSKIPFRNNDGKIIGVLGTYLDITERKKVEDKLIQSESKFRLVWEKTADGMRITNEKGIVISANPAYCLLMGKPLEEIMGQPISVVYESSKRKHILKQHQKLFSSKSIPQYLEKEITLWNGKRVSLELSNSFLEIENQPLLSLSVFRDITKKKEADKLLAEANNIINRSLTVVFLWKNVENLPVEFVTNNVNKLFGYSAKDFLEEKITYDKIVHCEDHDRVLAELKDHSNRGEVQSYYHEPYRIVNKDGDIKWVEDQTYIRRNVQGEITHYEGIINDITQRIKIEEKLREQNLFMDSLLNSIPLPVFYKDKYGKYFSVNNSFENIFGITKEAIIGKTVFDLYPPDLADIYFTKDKELFENGGIQVYETQIKDKNDSRRHVILNKSVFTNAKGEIEGLIGVYQDITERKLMDMKLQQSESELRIAAERYSKAQEMGHVGNWEYDIQQDTFWGSDEAKRIYGFDLDSEKFTVEEVEKLIPERDRVHQALVDLLEFNKVYNLEFQINPLDSNEPKIIHSIAELVMDEENKPIKVVGVVQDITERKLAEESLKKQTYLLARAQEIGKIGTWEFDIVNNNLAWTKENYRIFGIDNDTPLSYELFLATVHPDDRDYVNDSWKIGMETKEYDIEHRLIVNDEVRWVREKAEINYDNDEKPIKAIGFTQDITDFKNILNDHKESEEKFRTLFENSPDLIGLTDLKGNILDINRVAAGYNKEDVVGTNIAYYLTEKQIEEFNSAVRKALDTGKTYSYNPVITTPEGVQKHWHNRVSVLNFEGEQNKLVINFTDVTEQKLAEEALKESEEFLRAIFDNSLNAIMVADDLGNYLFVNKSAAEMFGYSEKELLKMNIGQIRTSIPANASELYKKYIKIGKEIGEFEFLKSNGEQRIALYHAVRVKENFNLSILSDMTEQKIAEEKMRILTAGIEESPTTVVITDTEGNIEYVNKSFETTTGYTREEAIGQNPRVLKSGKTSKEFYEKLWETISSGKTFRGEMLNKRKNGTLYWEDAVISPIKDEQNNIINYLAIKADITEIKLLQDKLKKYNKDLEKRVDERTSQLAKSEENYRTLAESMNAYICSVDIDHKINYVNSALLLQLKKKPEEIIGNDLSNILELFNTKKNIKIANTAIKKGELAKIVAKAPWDKWIEWELDFVKKSQAKNYNFIILGHDITERIEIENKTKEALIKEKELGQLKSKFVSTVSHEFRTPLTSIYSSIELLERYGEKWVNEKKLNHFQRMKSSIERLTTMLEEMLLLGRAESSKTKFSPENTNLNKLCLSFIKDTKPLLAKDQYLEYNFNLDEVNYLVDTNLLRIVLTNLISNSIKYSPNGGNISLNVSEGKDKIKFSVADSGMGISKNDIKNIFKPFYRTDNVSTISGSGLGLSIVKEYAKLHKGTIKVESELGKGSIFTLSISKITNI